MATAQGDDEYSVTKSDFYVVHGMRLVKPYYFNFRCRVKRRWIGRNVIDVFLAEFPARDRQYYEQALAEGKLTVEDTRRNKAWNGGPLEDGQCIRHHIHRHEPPALAQLPQVIAVTDSMVAVNKPASLPVHTSGQYRKNTVQALVELHNPELGSLYSVHRLDKCVSGMLLFARSPEAARIIQAQIIDRSVQKVYVARVIGRFPSEDRTVEGYLDWDPKMNKAAVVENPGIAEENNPAAVRKKDPKYSKTDFRFIKFSQDGKTSIVECRPRTGRTHQIRIHLQHLGFPIANDFLYGGTMRQHPPDYSGWRFCQDTCSSDMTRDERICHKEKMDKHLAKYPYKVDEHLVDPLCTNCPAAIPLDYPVDLEPLWLHAIQYSSNDWNFQCPMPEWAS